MNEGMLLTPISTLVPYPIDLSDVLALRNYTPDAAGVPCRVNPPTYDPTVVAQYALAHWNQYLATQDESHARTFLAQAQWLVDHEVGIGEDAGGWPIFPSHPEGGTNGPWLSATAQGNGVSALIRAYRLTSDDTLLEVLQRVVLTFKRDILDGGVSAPMGSDSVFFEEVAIYPATHVLSGCIFALIGLYEYAELTGDIKVNELIQRSLQTLHRLFDEFDAGFWTYYDLSHWHLSTASQLALQTSLLRILACFAGCEHCSLLAASWEHYQHQRVGRVRAWLALHSSSFVRRIWGWVQKTLFPQPSISQQIRVCVAVPAFPVTGGVWTFLDEMSQEMLDKWQTEYVTQHLGPNPAGYVIHRFGTRRMTPWFFPFIWLYGLAGFCKFVWLMLRGAGYHLILAQDGVVTGAFAALAAKVTGVRVVCIDHSDLSLFIERNNQLYRTQRLRELATKPWPWPVRFIARQLLILYWPSRRLLAGITARLVDHYFVPGIPEDGVNELCKQIGVRSSHITRFASTIETERHIILDAEARATMRKKKGIAADARVVTLVCRLSLEKGLEIALEAISQALSTLPDDLRTSVRVIIAGDGPLREQLEQDIRQRGLEETCLLWGEASADEVISILGISDIFLYTSQRGAYYSLAVLEAMASGCAVIASTEPPANALLLDEGRGIAVLAGDSVQTSIALEQLLRDPQRCRVMGSLAREYIARYHSPEMFRRALLRVTYWSALDEFLGGREKSDG